MKDILSEIIANKRFEVDLQKQAISIEQLQEGISEAPAIRSMKQALVSSKSGVIAEFKRRSPSKGWIKQGSAPGRDYSVLCEGRRFRPLYPHRREVFRREPERHSYCTPFGRGSYSQKGFHH